MYNIHSFREQKGVIMILPTKTVRPAWQLPAPLEIEPGNPGWKTAAIVPPRAFCFKGAQK